MRSRFSILLVLVLCGPLLVVAAQVPAAARITPRLTLAVHPAPFGQTAAGKANKTGYWGKVTPARRGAVVRLERRTAKGRWVVVNRTRQRANGTFRGLYTAWPRSAERLRVRSVPGRTSRLWSSPVRTRRTRPIKFNENFWGTRLNADRWATRFQPMQGSRPCAKPDPSRVKVGNGVATLSVRKFADWCAASSKHKAKGKYLNAMIGTTEKYRFRRGVFSARIKFERPEGMHGAFWLQGPPETGAEIDVAEYFGATSPSNFSILIHHTTSEGTTRTWRKRGDELPTRRILGRKKTPWNTFHVYTVRWNRHGYQFFLDGKHMVSTSRPHVSTAPQEIVLSLLTSDWEIGRLKSTRPVMQVDWVRVWQAR